MRVAMNCTVVALLYNIIAATTSVICTYYRLLYKFPFMACKYRNMDTKLDVLVSCQTIIILRDDSLRVIAEVFRSGRGELQYILT